MKKKLSPEIAAALASGGVAATEVETATEPGATDAPVVTTEAAAVDPAVTPPVTTTEAPVTPPVTTEAPTPAATGSDALVTHLKAELKEQRDQVTTLTADLTATKTKLSAQEALVPALQTIVLTATERLAVALNVSTADLAGLGAQALADRFTLLNADFAKKFKVGAQSTPAAPAANAQNSNVVPFDPRTQAAVGATQLK